MRIALPDSAREAFWFLVVAGGALLALRLIGLAADAGAPDDALAQAARPFQRGYWLRDPYAVVPDGMGLWGRLGIAAAAGLLTITPMLLLKGRAGVRTAPRLLLGTAPFLIPAALIGCALAAPRCVASISSQGVRLKERTALIAGMGIPGTAREFMYTWNQAVPELRGADGPRPWIALRLNDRQVVLLPPGHGHEAKRLAQALSGLKQAAQNPSP